MLKYNQVVIVLALKCIVLVASAMAHSVHSVDHLTWMMVMVVMMMIRSHLGANLPPGCAHNDNGPTRDWTYDGTRGGHP